MIRRFTGWHMAAILCGFFGIVIAVNLVMASAAISGFGGTIIDNSYVASQSYNQWLAQSEAQRRLSWAMDAALDADRHIVLTPVRGTVWAPTARADARQPLGAAPERQLAFANIGDGRLRSLDPLPAGRWQVRIEIKDKGETVRLLEKIP